MYIWIRLKNHLLQVQKLFFIKVPFGNLHDFTVNEMKLLLFYVSKGWKKTFLGCGYWEMDLKASLGVKTFRLLEVKYFL